MGRSLHWYTLTISPSFPSLGSLRHPVDILRDQLDFNYPPATQLSLKQTTQANHHAFFPTGGLDPLME